MRECARSCSLRATVTSRCSCESSLIFDRPVSTPEGAFSFSPFTVSSLSAYRSTSCVSFLSRMDTNRSDPP